jgi:signal peptidase I
VNIVKKKIDFFWEKHKLEIKNEAKSLLRFLAVLYVFLTFIFQPFTIPSGSMIPTLLIGDYLIVNKFCYGYGGYSFPFVTKKVFDGRFDFFSRRNLGQNLSSNFMPQRGDVVVFRNPKDQDRDYVKRLVGIPGDRIQLINGVVHVNGKSATLERVEDFNYTLDDDDRTVPVPQYVEKILDGPKHHILKIAPFGSPQVPDNFGPVRVPKDHFFFLGDNRDSSQDSRFFEKVGFIPLDQLVGRVEILFFSTSAKWWQFWKFFSGARFSRILKKI